jgi:hypothetical protein
LAQPMIMSAQTPMTRPVPNRTEKARLIMASCGWGMDGMVSTRI